MAEISKTPWDYAEGKIRDADGFTVAWVFDGRTDGPLLAAAPALKEALEEARPYLAFQAKRKPTSVAAQVLSHIDAALALCNPKEGE